MILITKTDEWCEKAGRLAQIVFGDELVWIKGNVGDPMPEIPEGDIISFLSPWIIPAEILGGRLAINFHPGSSNYPGIGCYNFALHEGADIYGAVCHHMLPAVDSGAIISEQGFELIGTETIETLKYRTMVLMLEMYHHIIGMIGNGIPLPVTALRWQRKPFTRKQLNQLYKDFPNTRATRYPDAA